MLIDAFDMEELRVLAADAGVNWDTLRGDTILAKAAALVRWAETHDKLLVLTKLVIQARPNANWS